jgi:hypothetical protein
MWQIWIFFPKKFFRMGGNPNLFFVAKWQRFAAKFFKFLINKKMKNKKKKLLV